MKKSKKKYSERIAQYDTFQHIYNFNDNSTYIYNPYTGETATLDSNNYVNRVYSLWAPTEKPSKVAIFQKYFPEFYLSRQWGRRKFKKFESRRQAAAHIVTVARGFLARHSLRKYYKSRYLKILDSDSGYYYFYDTYYPNSERVWYKPRLAFPNDIEVGDIRPYDKQDYLRNKSKYSYTSFLSGPYVRRELKGWGKQKAERSEVAHYHFFEINQKLHDAITYPKDIDFDQYPLGSVVHMMDGDFTKDVILSDYLAVRVACEDNNLKKVLDLIDSNREQPLIMIYGLHTIGKLSVPHDSKGNIDVHARRAMELFFEVIVDKQRIFSLTAKAFALHALYGYFTEPAARYEFYDISEDSSDLPMEGPRGKQIMFRIRTLNRYLENLDMDVSVHRIKEGRGFVDVETKSPTERSTDIAQYALLCLGLLANNQEHREMLTDTCIEAVLTAIYACPDDPLVLIAGLRCLYNYCYRCESGQVTVKSYDCESLVHNIRRSFPGDVDVLKECRKLEISMSEDGWRGNVEHIIEEENLKKGDTQYRPRESTFLANSMSRSLDKLSAHTMIADIADEVSVMTNADSYANSHNESKI